MIQPIARVKSSGNKYYSQPSTPGQPHKWAEEIKAWADGYQVEWRYGIDESKVAEPYELQENWNAWRPCLFPSQGEPNWFSGEIVFRIADENYVAPKMWTRLEVEMDLWPAVRCNGSMMTLHEVLVVLQYMGLLVDDSKPAAPNNTPISPDPPEAPSTPELGGRGALVRYCPACGHLGPAPAAPFIACCPDHSEAAMVPRSVAEQAQREFNRSIGRDGEVT